MHARPGGTYLRVEVRPESVTPGKPSKVNPKGKKKRPSGVQPRKPTIQNLQARRRAKQARTEMEVTRTRPVPTPRAKEEAIPPRATDASTAANIDAVDSSIPAILRPIGLVTESSAPEEAFEEDLDAAEVNEDELEALEYVEDEDDFFDDQEQADPTDASPELSPQSAAPTAATIASEQPRTMEDFAAEVEANLEGEDDEPITVVERFQRSLRHSIPVTRITESAQFNQIREGVTTIAKSRGLRMAVPNFQQIRAALGIGSFTALTISMAVAYHVPTSLYGLEALLRITSAAMGLSVLALPVTVSPLRLLERWLLAVCAAAVVYFGDPVSVLAETGAESRLVDSDVEVRANGVRTLTALGRKDFDGLNLKGADLSGLDLAFSSFQAANLIGADLSYAKLTRARLDGAQLNDVDLNGADLFGASAAQAVGFHEASCSFRTKLPSDFACERGKPIPRPR